MEIKKDRVVSLIYELRKDNATGEVIEKIDAKSALQFVFGSGMLLKDFESNISGLKVGNSFQFPLTSAQAYGEYNQEAKVEMPIDVFKDEKGKVNNSLLVVGTFIPMQDGQGNMYNGKVLEVTDSTVQIDFNHPLAGQNLHFSGEVIEVREASAEELQHGHVHGSHGCEDDSCETSGGCGCGCH